ncbi:MAG: phosphatidylglycerophosphatase A [Deltaproteobacteria bacterium]|nr:MAG: phosphatidylglycerophosphatase A [Deltaproteobacteria bacterium]
MSKDYYFVAVGSALGLGLAPIAPGTSGALLGVLIHVGVYYCLPIYYNLWSLILFFLGVVGTSYYLTPWAVAYWQNQDPPHFVLDEVAGYLLVPILFRGGQFWLTVLYGFLLFRFFDILKIPPANLIDQNMKGAWGIILDDLVSACYAVAVLYALLWLGVL